MSDLWEIAKEIANKQNPDNFENIKEKVKYTTPKSGNENIELLLSRCQIFQELNSDEIINTFVEETKAQIIKKCRFVNDKLNLDMHQIFLRKVARRSTRLPRTKIFTTNYDLCIEKAASMSRFIIIDGFSHSYPQEFDGSFFCYDLVKREQGKEIPDFIPNVFHLYKMHGSVDWERNNGQIIKNCEADRPCMIYPHQGKFQSSYDQPYIEMMSRFQTSLRQPNTGLLIIGFGFNDFHIVQPIMSAIRSNVGIKVMFVNPSLESSKNSNIEEIIKLIKAGDSRISMLVANFEDFVPHIPDLISETEEEQYYERYRNIRGK